MPMIRPAYKVVHHHHSQQLWLRPSTCLSVPWSHANSSVFFPRYHSVSCAFNSTEQKKRVVFLGTPEVAANVLDKLLSAAEADGSIFQIAAIVTQPPAAKRRGQKILPSAVAELAMKRNFPPSFIFSPEKAGEETFLAGLKDLQPDLCITASYGNYLPSKFLKIPTRGTVNIHPSLLPLYRGAAPVQRAIQDGVHVTGVTVAYTVRSIDAGPIISSEAVNVDDYIKAPELLQLLFEKGTNLLLKELPSILDGSAADKAQEQDHSRATHAPKVTVEESWLDFNEPASVLHNKVRAFADWPGSKARLEVINPSTGKEQSLDLKIITTKPLHCVGGEEIDRTLVRQEGSSLIIHCKGDSALQILELQPAGKRVMSAKDFLNGLRGQKLRIRTGAEMSVARS